MSRAVLTLEIPVAPIVDAVRQALQGLSPVATEQVMAMRVAPIDSRVEVVARQLLTALGCPPAIKGFGYITAAISHLLRDCNQPVTKVIYPAVARQYGTSPTRVERAIRHAITVMDSRGDSARLRQLCGRELMNSNVLRGLTGYVAAQLD